MGFSHPDFRTLFESVPGLYLVLAPDLRIVAVSDAYLRATMTTRDAILGHGVFEVFPDNPDDPTATGVSNLRTSLESVLAFARTDTMAVQKYDVRRPDAEGGGFQVRYWSPQNSPVLGPNGEVRFIIHRVEDVTEFVRLRQAGLEREELSQALREMESEVFTRAQEVASANRSLSTANAVLARLYNQIAVLLSRASELHFEPGPSDEWDLLRQPMSPEEILARVSQMIADYQRLEEQLRQSQKMEAVGRLAGGVAHDFNNLLTVIAGYAALLREDLGTEHEQPELDEIQTAVKRASELTRQLLTFSRKQMLQPQIIDVNNIVRGMEGMLRRLIGEDIVLVATLAGDLARVKADPGQIEQVVMNLVVNARDAMPDGGKLIIETKAVPLDTGQLPALSAGRYVQLSVSDTGHGMTAEIASRIFEPFFTTKEVGKGTGLGLATALGIMEQSGGTITVDSRVGAGTTFRAYLPATEEQPADEGAGQQTATQATGRATVLLVEDETPLRKLIHQVLRGAGHIVLEAANGDEAFAIGMRHSGKIDLLLTDVVMPGMKGPELVAKLRARRPAITVLYMSGYDNELVDKKHLESGASFLQKPFSPKMLLKRIHTLLGYGGAEGEKASFAD
jgi:signal transduction histidine kinase/CheY-like chemotaxis protein